MLTIIKIEIIAIIKQILVYKVDVSPILLSKHKLKMWKYFLILTSNIIFKIKQKNKNISTLKKKTSYQNYEQRNYDNLDSLYANKF